jgi:hypothetical protein
MGPARSIAFGYLPATGLSHDAVASPHARVQTKGEVLISLNRALALSAALVMLTGCGQESKEGISVDQERSELSFWGALNREVALKGDWHLMVFLEGSKADLAFMRTEVKPGDLYDALVSLGASPGNNVNGTNFSDPLVASEGTRLELKVSWDGAPKAYPLSELLIEKTGLEGGAPRGIDLRFTGNRTPGEHEGHTHQGASDTTGCLTCLYTCSAGIATNAAVNKAVNTADGTWRYVADPSLLPPDGTEVKLTYTVLKN